MKARENSPPALPPAPAFRRARYAKTTGDESGSVAFGPTSASMDNTLHDLHGVYLVKQTEFSEFYQEAIVTC